jgi:hypothetical protein
MYGILVILATVIIGYGVRTGARRFERRQRELKRWDRHGPLEESEPPPLGLRGNLMNWGLEAKGLWPTKIIRRRPPNER